MTNILKDVWEDRSRGACWLPQEVFTRHGIDLAQLAPGRPDARFDAGMRELVGVAHAHLRNALSLYAADSGAGDRHPALLPVGHRAGGAHAAQDSARRPASPAARR